MPDPTSFPGLLVAAPETRTMPALHCLSQAMFLRVHVKSGRNVGSISMTDNFPGRSADLTALLKTNWRP